MPAALQPIADILSAIPPNLKLAIALALPVVAVLVCDALIRRTARREARNARLDVAALRRLAEQAQSHDPE